MEQQRVRRRRHGDKDYINNKEFTILIIQEQDKCAANPNHKISPRLIELLFILNQRLSGKNNFKNYTYKEDMIQEGLYDCVKAVQRGVFDRKRDNGFAYFTEIAKNAFKRWIKSEKHQSNIKWMNAEHMALGDEEMTMELANVLKDKHKRVA